MRRPLAPSLVLAAVAVSSLVLVTNDDHLGLSATVLCIAAATAGLLALVELEHAGHRLDPLLVAGVVVMLLLVALAGAPRNSRDLWSYAMYGRLLSVHHANPWVTLPAHFHGDPYLARVARGWRHTTSIYGPAFELLAGLLTRLGGNASDAVRLLFAGTFALAAATASGLVYRRTDSPAAAAFVALNPAVLAGVVAGGHNDILVGLGLLVGVLNIGDDRPVAAGVAVGLASLVKLTGVIGLAALVAWVLVHRGRRRAATLAGVGGGVVLAGYLPLGGAGFSAFVHNRAALSRASVWELPRLLTGLDVRHAVFRFGLSRHDNLVVVAAGTAVAGAVTLTIVWWLRRSSDPAVPVIAALGGYLLFAPYVLQWYPGWAMPTVGLVPRHPVARVLAVQGGLLTLVYEVRTRHLTPTGADVVWWSGAVATAAVCTWFLRALRADGAVATNHDPPAAISPPAGG